MADYELEFQKIFVDFQPRILRYLTRLVGAHEAEDLTQEVLVKINKGLPAFRGESQLSTWIYRIATNAALNKLHRSSFQRIRLGGDLVSGGEENKSPSVEQNLIRNEMNECIRDFVDNLPADYRTVVVLSEMEDLKNSEIAEILGVSLYTVKIRLHRAMVRLKKELMTHCSFYHDERNELACDLKSAFAEFRERS